MLSTTERCLADLIEAVAENERELERRRCALIEDPLFTPSSCFARLDSLSAGYITPHDLRDFLCDCGFAATSAEVAQLVEQTTALSPLRLYRTELFDLILPKDHVLRSIALRKDLYPPEPLGRMPEFLLGRVLQCAIEGNTRLERHRSSLRLSFDYSAFDAFRAIDRYGTGYIGCTDLFLFLQRFGISRSCADYFIMALDKDKDGKLSYIEFKNGIDSFFAGSAERYLHSERKPLRRELSYERVARSEYRPRRLWSAERFEEPEVFSRNYYRNYSNSSLSPKVESIYKQGYETPLKKEYGSPARESFATDYTSPSKSHRSPLSKRLNYSLSPSKQAEVGIVLAMEKQLGYERRIEQVKEELALQPDFNLMEGFRFFDYERKGYASASDFYEGMKNLGVLGSYSDISALFKRMNVDSNGRLKYSDYYLAIAPRKEPYEKMLLQRSPYKSTFSTSFTSTTRLLYKELLNLLIEYEQATELTRQRLRRNTQFDPYGAFTAVDLEGKGCATLGQVQSYRKSSCENSWREIRCTQARQSCVDCWKDTTTTMTEGYRWQSLLMN
eukprot:TRINITY_DN13130_c0_g2_i11.p1 TRINITY_DN13130_c0_g2~~TRINITY_DN13130_c0_g2_i11.p1  ORF type:complete len:558 (+),score=102.11 TRINITY_DN13130_c0_g2_i11:239-1912(+)